MNIVIGKKTPEKPQRTNYLDNYQKLGFWATVIEVNSKCNNCTVLTSNKEVIRNIPVATTREWISDDSQERNLPPVGSFVFIIMPDNCISNAFILCSGYPKGEVSLQGLYAKNDDEKKVKDTEREIVTPSHWNEKEDYVSGTRTLTSPDGNIQISAILENKESKSLEIKGFGKTITLDENGIKLELSGDINLETDGDLTVKAKSLDVNEGAIIVDDTGIKMGNGSLEITSAG